MKYIIHTILFFTIVIFSASNLYAGILPGGSSDIEKSSITITGIGNNNKNFEDTTRLLGFKVLAAAKIVISGFALVYLVLIGVYMIVFSENEERIKSQRKQITYALVGFLFLNIPGLVYTIFFGPDIGLSNASSQNIGDGSSVDFWDITSLTGANGFIPMIIGFFEIFIFGVAILVFTWGFFRLILSGGNEEIQKKAKSNIIYGVLGLLFLGFVKFWSAVIVRGDFFGEFATLGNKFIGLALYFAAPVVIFFLVMASYYYISSAGDEERIKKAKSIFINTLIAALILLGAFSFLSDLVSFTL